MSANSARMTTSGAGDEPVRVAKLGLEDVENLVPVGPRELVLGQHQPAQGDQGLRPHRQQRVPELRQYLLNVLAEQRRRFCARDRVVNYTAEEDATVCVRAVPVSVVLSLNQDRSRVMMRTCSSVARVLMCSSG